MHQFYHYSTLHAFYCKFENINLVPVHHATALPFGFRFLRCFFNLNLQLSPFCFPVKVYVNSFLHAFTLQSISSYFVLAENLQNSGMPFCDDRLVPYLWWDIDSVTHMHRHDCTSNFMTVLRISWCLCFNSYANMHSMFSAVLWFVMVGVGTMIGSMPRISD